MKQIRGIWFPDGDTHFQAQLAASPLVAGKGTYQFAKYQAALRHVRRRDHAVDVGAHVGLWSRLMAMDFAKVTAFEPLAEHRECFARNLEGASNVNLHPFALSDRLERLSIHMPADNTGHAHVRKDGESVLAVPLDSQKCAGIDLLKIDVEGFELQVVTGAEQTIRSHRPVIVIEQKPNNAERYGNGRLDAVRLLKSWGMKEAQVLKGDHIMVFA
jgi:FkbM family methyltransferase